MKMIIENILKDSLFPIATEHCYNAGKEIWKVDKLSAAILFLAGFSLTHLGITLVIIIILIIKFKEEIIKHLSP